MPRLAFGRTVRAYVLAIVLAGAIIPLAAVGAWLALSGARAGERLLEQQLNVSLANIAADVQRRWELRQGDLLMLADNQVARRATTRSLSAADSDFLMQAARAIDASILSFSYADRPGRVTWSTPTVTTFPDTSRRRERGPAIDLQFPVLDSTGAQLGSMRARIALAGLLTLDSVGRGVPGSRLAVRDRATGKALLALTDSVGFPNRRLEALRGDQWLSVTRAIETPAIDIALSAGTRAYVAPFAHAATAGMIAVVVVGMGALLVTIVMTTRLTRSLDSLVDATDAVSRGELTTAVSATGPVELQRLARAFNLMTESLQRVLSELAQRRALSAVGEFAASLSHEVRNALTPVQVDLERANERLPDDDRAKRLVARALGHVRRLERAVSGALAIARSGSVVAADLDLREVLEAAAEASLAAFRAGESRIELDIPEEPLPVRGDADALRHLFVNLLFNAGQALHGAGVAHVVTSRDNGSVVVSIVDEGPGMSDAELARAGEPFYTTRPGGSGLGLPIARQIAVAHGGSLEIARADSGGTLIRVMLPTIQPGTESVATEG